MDTCWPRPWDCSIWGSSKSNTSCGWIWSSPRAFCVAVRRSSYLVMNCCVTTMIGCLSSHLESLSGVRFNQLFGIGLTMIGQYCDRLIRWLWVGWIIKFCKFLRNDVLVVSCVKTDINVNRVFLYLWNCIANFIYIQEGSCGMISLLTFSRYQEDF